MAVQQVIDDALNARMSRKAFLGQLGTLLLAVVGVSSVLHVLDASSRSLGNRRLTSQGYGSSVYGGRQARFMK
jgi:hypothetical protein